MSKITIDQVEVDKLVIEAVQKHVGDKLSYNRALGDMVEQSMENHRDDIQDILNDTLKSVVGNPVGHLEGAVEKAANIYRQDPTLKSKMILAIENIINENK